MRRKKLMFVQAARVRALTVRVGSMFLDLVALLVRFELLDPGGACADQC